MHYAFYLIGTETDQVWHSKLRKLFIIVDNPFLQSVFKSTNISTKLINKGLQMMISSEVKVMNVDVFSTYCYINLISFLPCCSI